MVIRLVRLGRCGAVFALALSLSGCKAAKAKAGAAPARLPAPAGQEPARSAAAAASVATHGASSAGENPATRVAPPHTADPAPHDGCPPEMTRVGRVCIDRWEDSLVDPYGKTHDPSKRPLHDLDYRARPLPGVRPQAYISRLEARAVCESAGKRLCTLREWYAACEGPHHTTYPYGASFDKKRCNVGKPHLLSRFSGGNPLRWRYAQDFNNPALDREPGFLAKTGAYSGCTNAYGVYDMVGNLHEWVSDTVDRSLPIKIPLRDGIRARVGPDTGHGIFMGGFFSTGSQHGRGCRFITIGHGPTYHDYSTGFRCCRTAAGGAP